MPAGNCWPMRVEVATLSALPSAMMSPPLAMDTPSAITSLPWWRTFIDRRVHIAALDVGNVAQAQLVARMLPRIGMARSSSTASNWPATRTCTTSSGVCTAPADSTAFCWPSCASTWFMSRPSWARRFCEISMYSFSSCTPNSSTLAHIGHTQQLLAHVVGKGLELGVIEAVGLQRIDHAVHVAKIVIEKRALTRRPAACRACRPSSCAPGTRCWAPRRRATSP